MDLKNYESIINTIARRYARNPDDLEDYKQLAKITMWEVLQKKPDADESYVAIAIKNGIEEIVGREDQAYAPQIGAVRGLEAAKGIGAVRGMIGKLREKHGRFYIKKIQDSENDPRGIVRRLMRSVIEEVHGLSKEEAAQKINYKFFVDNGLQPLLWMFYDNSPFYAITDAFKGELIPWDFRRKPQGFWEGKRGYERALESIEWFANKKNIKNVRDCRQIKLEDFEAVGLSGMIQRHFNSSPYLALRAKFPELKPWQTKQTPAGFFDNKDNQLDAVLSFLLSQGIPSILEFTPEETYETGIRTIVSRESMDNSGLRGLIEKFGGSTYRLYSTLFPAQILPWTLCGTKEPWKKDPKKTAAQAIRWLFDDYLKVLVADIPEYASCKLFWRVGFSGILTNRRVGFNSSPYAAVDSAYPGIFSKEDFDRYREVISLQTKKLKRDWKS